MSTFKRILAWTLVAISILGILICALGIIGSWLINEPLTDGLLKLISGAEAALSRVENSLALAGDQIKEANSALTQAREAASQLGDRIENNSPILDLIAQTLNEGLGPAVQRIREAFLQIQERVLVVNNTIEALNRLPGIQLPTLTLQLQALNDQADKIADAVQQLQKNISDFRSGIVENLAPLMNRVDRIAAFLTTLEQDVNAYLDQVKNLQSAMQGMRAAIPSAIDKISILVSILFVWLILAQVSLLLVARVYIKTGRMVWDLTSSQEPAEDLSQVSAQEEN